MNRPPAFQFYPKDFLMDDKVAAMNLEARGAYITLLCLCWNNDGLPNDEEEIKEMCGNPGNWERIWKKVGKCFYENSGKLHNKRLDKEREKQKHWKEKSKEGGIKSGEIRRKKSREKTKGGSNIAKGSSTKREPNPKPPSSSSSSSSSSNKKEEKNNMSEKIFSEFDSLWKSWPKEGRFKKDICSKKFKALIKAGKLERFKKTTQGYAQFLKYKKERENFDQRVMNLSTWLNNWEGEEETYSGFKYKPGL